MNNEFGWNNAIRDLAEFLVNNKENQGHDKCSKNIENKNQEEQQNKKKTERNVTLCSIK